MAHTTSRTSSERGPVYELLAHDIKAMGVEAVFGLMSDDTALFATSLDTAGVRFFGARHENAAIAMADGYAYATGRLGVAVIGRGPALANGLHSAVYASRTGCPVLIIYGEGPPAARRTASGRTIKLLMGSASCVRQASRPSRRRARRVRVRPGRCRGGCASGRNRKPASADQRTAF